MAVMVRPEQFTITVDGDLADIDTAGVRGAVEDLHYFGHDTIMTVRPTERDDLGVLRIRIVGARSLDPGTGRHRQRDRPGVRVAPRDVADNMRYLTIPHD